MKAIEGTKSAGQSRERYRTTNEMNLKNKFNSWHILFNPFI